METSRQEPELPLGLCEGWRIWRRARKLDWLFSLIKTRSRTQRLQTLLFINLRIGLTAEAQTAESA